MGRRGAATCGTCKDHGIRCDGTTPTCLNCAQSRQKCQGYAITLSWPRATDRRRAMVVKSPWVPSAAYVAVSHVSDARFVNTSSSDVALHRSLTNQLSAHNARSWLDVPSVWNPFRLEVHEGELFEYFKDRASQSLATFGQGGTEVGAILIRILLASGTPSARAVLKAMLAFSSVHRHGVNAQAVELKIVALQSLAEALSGGTELGAREAVEHATAAMLLCSFETHHVSCTSGQWMGYLYNAKKMIEDSRPKDLLRLGAEAAVILDWVRYHEVLTRFSLRHWNREVVDPLLTTSTHVFWTAESEMNKSAFSMLGLLSEICSAVPVDVTPSEPADKEDLKGFVNVLDWRLRNSTVEVAPTDSDAEPGEDPALLLRLYKLAILLYLARISEHRVSQSARAQEYADCAFALSQRLSVCVPQFPAFILGCEARTDEQRAVLLDLIARTEAKGNSRSVGYTKMQLQAIWAQDDLADDSTMGYGERLTSIMSRCAILPTFV